MFVGDMAQDYNLEIFFIKNLFRVRNLTNFRKTVQTGVNLRLSESSRI